MSLAHLTHCLRDQSLFRVTGRVSRVQGLLVQAEGLHLPVGSTCDIVCRAASNQAIDAEVVGFRDGATLLVPSGTMAGVAPGDPVRFEGRTPFARVSPHLLGRVIDSSGEPLDGKGPILAGARTPLEADPTNPLKRQRIDRPFGTGVRAIDSMLTCGRGQRVGIFAGSGVGKSVLLGMLARRASCPVRVIALIGERGREVREFIERDLGPEGLERSVVIVSTSDEPPVRRLRAARRATAIAEWFRDRGEDVLLMVDSITRIALAQREIGLSANEPPTTRGYPPSVFGILARLLERAGPGEHGSITGFYTVLVEGDDEQDPIGDAVRGILDGHIWLSREIANRGHFPAIDVLRSVSRVMNDVIDETQLAAARRLTEDLAKYREVEDLVQLGAYVPGGDPKADVAIRNLPSIQELLQQSPKEESSFDEARSRLIGLYPETARATEGERT